MSVYPFTDLNISSFDSPKTLSSLSPLINVSSTDCTDLNNSIGHLLSNGERHIGIVPSHHHHILNTNSMERFQSQPKPTLNGNIVQSMNPYSPMSPSHPFSSPPSSIASVYSSRSASMSPRITSPSVIVCNSATKVSETETNEAGSESTNGESVNMAPSTNNNNQQQHASTVNQPQQLCKVCGDGALGKNFGVVTCGSCKIFFRRNNTADKTKLQCRNSNRCTISKTNRRNCAACRLRRCIDLGMQVKQSKQSKHMKNGSSTLLRQQTNGSTTSSSSSPLSLTSSTLTHGEQIGCATIGNVSRLNRTHSGSSSAVSSSDDDLNGYEDLPTLIPCIETETILRTQYDPHPNSFQDHNHRNSNHNEQHNSVDSVEFANQEYESKILEPNNHQTVISQFDDNPNEFDSNELYTNYAKYFDDRQMKGLVPTSSTTSTIIDHNRRPNSFVTSVIVNTTNDSHFNHSIEHQPFTNSLSTMDDCNEDSNDDEIDENLTEMAEDVVEVENAVPIDVDKSNIIIEVKNYEKVNSTNELNEQLNCFPVGLNSDDECAEKRRLMERFIDKQQSLTIYNCGYGRFQPFESPLSSDDGLNSNSTSTNASYPQSYEQLTSRPFHPKKFCHMRDLYHSDLEVVKTEAKSISMKINTQINELCKMTSLLRVKLGFEYTMGTMDTFQLQRKEMYKINQLNDSCRMIDIKPTSSEHRVVNVFDSLRQGIFYANKMFKIFEQFWSQNSEMRELIRQDETGFDRKKNDLLHMLYHLRGVYNFDDNKEAWAVFNGDNAFTYIKLTMFNESIRKEMSSMHHQYINAFPKWWREDPTIFNMMTFLLIFGAFEETHSQFKSEKIRYFTFLYLVKRYFEQSYGDESIALQYLHWMLKLIDELKPLCSDCFTACTHSLEPKILREIGPNYAACLMREMKQKAPDEGDDQLTGKQMQFENEEN
ncbi:hypothetical protein BLOT_012797 [Blomia tropicalis]|nr:hypothetical protein BLOT_012797 [Blomia tropicalis]